MLELEIISSATYGSSNVSAEFKVYSEINDNGIKPNGKIILEPVNAVNKNVDLFLTDKKYSGAILTNLNRKPITADNPIEIPLYYDNSENAFYLEDNRGFFMKAYEKQIFQRYIYRIRIRRSKFNSFRSIKHIICYFIHDFFI